MKPIAIVGIDLAKHCFHVVAQDEKGHEIHRKKLNRVQLIQYFAQLPPCSIAMEACGGSHFMAREVERFGHQPLLMAAQHVRPFVKSNKNDFADAQAICDAATRPTMRFIQPKTETQQTFAMFGTVRDAFIKDRTATLNRIHAGLLEVGISLPASYKAVRNLLPMLDEANCPPIIKALLRDLHSHFLYLDDRIKALDKQAKEHSANHDLTRRLMTMPGVGPISSLALAEDLGDGHQFRCGRSFSASIGLVPKQHTTGGKPVLLGISKRGNRNLRSLMVQCAWSYLMHLDNQVGSMADWARELLARKPKNVVVCAVANKLSRVAWSIAANHSEFEARPSAMSA